ncbi:ArnT family glycosyltransferase [Mycolicibacterium gadium]|uniref:Glycosyltransferase RgtA/B/C/D-like domain-containing protein n=1 Tax=Mycolicibacterium gadium TaxID=1794 RepID=A0A7I7WR79_MYCGU|nr:hypothetical protein [Mycolicibacterium gadium]BBZ18943.1 hypothetical protein MGAD_32780 [Mycolicibacterium gadium]
MTPVRRDGLVLGAILLLATVVRLVGLAGRGEFDDDQGTEMLTLLHWVRDGQIPLVGPEASSGTAHHGVAYYWLLAPSAFISDVDPALVVTTIALIGIAGVAATWWLGRTVGGALPGHVAALLMAISPSAIGASTFLWNANIVGPVAALAAASAWYAWRTRELGWWVLTAAATVLLVHAHLLAVLAVPPLIALFVADALRMPRRSVLGVVAATALIIAAGLTPVAIHELRTDFSETRGVWDYLFAESVGVNNSVGQRIGAVPVIFWRVLAWPVAGDVASAPLWALPTVFVTVVALAIAAVGAQGIARCFGRWTVLTTVWAIAALTVVAPTLAVIHPGLPRDQYHSWLDPITFVAIGIGADWMWSARSALVRSGAVAVVAVCAVSSILVLPSFSVSERGWSHAAQAAETIKPALGDAPTAVIGVNKSGGAIGFPLSRDGVTIVDPPNATFLVVTCDPLFERSIGLACGGPAEAAEAALVSFPVKDGSCFYNGPRRHVCILTRN